MSRIVKDGDCDGLSFVNLSDEFCILVFIKSSDVLRNGDEIIKALKAVNPFADDDYFSTKKILLDSNQKIFIGDKDLPDYYIVINCHEENYCYSLGRNPKGNYSFK